MVILRRFVTMAALMFWLGGFTFYTSIVVPIGTEILRSARRQGFITREVTYSLNVTAAVCLGVLAVECLLLADTSRSRYWWRWALWTLMVLCQAGLFVVHPLMDQYLQVKGGIVLDPEAFRPWHRLYLWLHTIQWGLGLVFILLMLIGWRREDRNTITPLLSASEPTGGPL